MKIILDLPFLDPLNIARIQWQMYSRGGGVLSLLQKSIQLLRKDEEWKEHNQNTLHVIGPPDKDLNFHLFTLQAKDSKQAFFSIDTHGICFRTRNSLVSELPLPLLFLVLYEPVNSGAAG